MTHSTMKSFLAAAIGVIAPSLLNCSVHAQAWPQKQVKVIVPLAAGGPADSMARATSQRLSEVFGQPFVVENLPGAGGAIAGQTVARAQPDGYTLHWVTSSQVTILPLIARLSYDPVKSLVPITAVAENRFVLVVNPSNLPVHTVSEFLDRVRGQPGRFSYAHAGTGTVTQLAMELFARRSNLQMMGVAYKGIAPAFTDVIAGHVPTMFASLADAVQQQKDGAIKLLAVSTDKRARQIPDVPTISESGVTGFHIASWNGLMAPVGTPRVIVEQISAEVVRATKTRQFTERLTDLGFDPVGNSPADFAAMLAAEIPMWTEAVKSAGLKPD